MGLLRSSPDPITRDQARRARETHAANQQLALFDFLRDEAVDAPPAQAARLDDRAWQLVEEAPPVSVAYAAGVLGVTAQALRPWIASGVLEAAADTKPARIKLDSLAQVREIIEELRELGQDRHLLSAAARRLEGEAISDSPRFQRSLGQMRRRESARTWRTVDPKSNAASDPA